MTIRFSNISKFKKRFLNINDNEPLSKFSLIVILALDVFVVYIIFAGLYDHTSLLTSHLEYLPNVCHQAIIEQNWTEETKIDKLQDTILSNDNSIRYHPYNFLDPSEVKKTHPACSQLLQKIKISQEDDKLLQIFRERQAKQEKQKQLSEKFKLSKEVYDTNLLESIATEAKENQVLSVEASSKKLSQELDRINKSIEESNSEISSTPAVVDLWKYLEKLSSQKQQVVADLKQFDFWYPIKALAWQLVFLLPLCGLFYFWNDRSIKKNNSIQILISSHLLVVSFIPIFFKIIELILDILPHRLLETLFKTLKSLNIIAFWHYFVILLAIISTIFAIFFIQKKLFSKEKMMRKRLAKGACHECGRKLPWQSHYMCPFCGVKQDVECTSCKKSTYIAGEYCINCGSSNWKNNDISG